VACATSAGPGGLPRVTYPETKRDSVVEELHGVQVADPYRWLEEADSPESKAWIDAQNALADQLLDSLPERRRFLARLQDAWDYPRVGVPWREGDRYFYYKNHGLQPQSVLYVSDQPGGPGRVLLDPNPLSADGSLSVSSAEVSQDGRLLAYGLSSGGSDWQEIRVRDVETGQDRPDLVRWVKFSSPAWKPDASGFFYGRFGEPAPGEELSAVNEHHQVYFHALGTEQSADPLVYARPEEPKWGFGPSVTHDGRYLVLHVWKGTHPENQVFYRELASEGPFIELMTGFDASYDLIGNQGPVFWFLTDQGAPLKRVIAVDLRRPDPAAWVTLIPESGRVVEAVSVVGDRFLVQTLEHARSRVEVVTLDGRPDGEVPLPGLGTASGFSGRREHRETCFGFTSFHLPETVYRFDLESRQVTALSSPPLDFDPASYQVDQVFYRSKDGTRIPMFLAHKKGLVRDRNRPTFLYGYGGFNINLTPVYNPGIRVWMDAGGVYAMPNLRGGGEYGEAWHQAGIRERKQNVFDDFVAAAEALTTSLGVTRPERMAVGGGSNGGLLVGASMVQRPELFAAAVAQVGVFDMLRFHKFTIGWAWTSDYGSPDDPTDFKVLLGYSPLHTAREAAYPATLITTADHDDRVLPGHSFKFAAELQHRQRGPAPILIKVDVRTGHGHGKPTQKRIEEQADKWAFIARALGMKLAQGF
jgi:prolyl oligopeptidase